VLLRHPVEIAAGGSADVPLSLAVPAMDGPVMAGELALAGDALACDDRWFFALPLRRPLNALIVDRSGVSGGGMKPSFFLTRAISAGGAGKAEAIEDTAWEKQSTDGVDAVWFTASALGGKTGWAKALAFADSGGTVVVMGDSQPEPLPEVWPVTAGSETSLPSGRIATRLLAPSHFLFEGVWSERTPFPPVPQRIARKCDAVGDAKTLATLAGGFPLLVELPRGKGRVLWLNASADRTWGDLPLSPVYVALVQQMARAGELSIRATTAAWVGEAWPDLSDFADDAAWPAAEGGVPSTRALRSGVFDAVSKDGKTKWRCAVNVRRAESDLRPMDAAKLQSMLPGRVVTGTQGIRAWREEIRREIPLWPWLLGAAAMVFLVEGWMSALAAKRRESAAGVDMPKGLERTVGV
jgi:hypothetical protein